MGNWEGGTLWSEAGLQALASHSLKWADIHLPRIQHLEETPGVLSDLSGLQKASHLLNPWAAMYPVWPKQD